MSSTLANEKKFNEPLSSGMHGTIRDFNSHVVDDTLVPVPVPVPVQFDDLKLPKAPDASAPHTPRTWSLNIRTCVFCPTGECNRCPDPYSSFFKTLYWENDDDTFIVPTELILSQPGWQCCQCIQCRQALKEAFHNHRVPRDVLQQVFGPTVSIVRSDKTIEHSWRILAALRLSQGKGIVAIVCGKGMGPEGEKVPMWKNVPLEKLISWNPHVLQSETAVKIISPWRLQIDIV